MLQIGVIIVDACKGDQLWRGAIFEFEFDLSSFECFGVFVAVKDLEFGFERFFGFLMML
jgi:hypothetical protein